MHLSQLSDDDLLQGLHLLAASQRRVMAEIVLNLAEVDARRVYAGKGFPSLFSYCVEELRFSEDEACRRIEAARLARKYPAVYELLKAGRVTLTVLGLLKPHVTSANCDELLAGVSGLTVRQAKEWLAARFPQPDVPWSIRKRPERSPAVCELPAAARVVSEQAPVTSEQVAPSPTAARIASEPVAPSPALARIESELVAPSPAPARVGRIEPLSQDRFLVKLTASRALRDKLELARDLMSHGNPNGDLAVVIERALDVLLDELERTRLGRTNRPVQERRLAQRTHVTSSTRREVVARDGLGCSFVAPDGRRCGARAFLQFDHKTPKGRGGDSEPQNVRLLCQAHNLFVAEGVYGTERMQGAVAVSRGKKQDERG